MGKRSASVLLVMSLAAGLLGLSAGVASATATESGFVSKINSERRARGMRALEVKSDLLSYGRRHSGDMADAGRIYHTGNLGGAVGGNWSELGENVGVGPDVVTLHKAFMNSPTHRDNVLHRSYNQVGVGVAYGEGRMYVTVMFAARGGSVAPVTTTRRTSTSRPAVTTQSAQAPRPSQVASAPAPRPAPVAPAAKPEPRTVSLLARLVGA